MQLSVRPVLFVVLSTFALVACKKDESLEKGLRSFEYDLSEASGSGFNGKVLFTENIDSSFNVLVTLNQTLLDSMHAVNIYNGRIDSPGTIAIPLLSIVGNGVAAQSETRDIREASLPDGLVIPLSYDAVLSFHGFVAVTLSETRMDSVISHVDL
ncbi:MAG: hypothetical protein EOP49_39960 [Sphingobacteriales bacterium]|nr:MAG: hypothetical protein EOP49_39960 [Sphingobacteriales bacterium]